MASALFFAIPFLLASASADAVNAPLAALQCGADRVRDHALLQLGSVEQRLVKLNARKLTCETCADAFRDLKGCAEGWDAVSGKPELVGCVDLGCRADMEARCQADEHLPSPTCSTCADAFAERKGCERGADVAQALEEMKDEPALAGCMSEECRAQIAARCQTSQSAAEPAVVGPHTVITCDTCADIFRDLHGCEARAAGNKTAMDELSARREFIGCDVGYCDAQIEERCSAAEHRAAPTCSTCADVFVAEGGCGRGDVDEALAEMADMPELIGCSSENCHAQFEARCANLAVEKNITESQTQYTMTCESCADVFHDLGGCKTMDSINSSALEAVTTSPEFVGCSSAACIKQIEARCSEGRRASPTCETCADVFAAAGGCTQRDDLAAAFEKQQGKPEFSGCVWSKCQTQVVARCAETQDASNQAEAKSHQSGNSDPEAQCVACVEAFSVSGSCAWVRSPAKERGAALLPDECAGVVPDCAGRIASRCMEEAGQFCQTAVKGDDCFQHVRWAMEEGIFTNPAIYAPLTQDSSFENFQMFLYLEGLRKDRPKRCPPPCLTLELPCHTAVAGDACHVHVHWAMKHGLPEKRARFPTRLSVNSSVGEVQGWLHQIHHGDCPKPCS